MSRKIVLDLDGTLTIDDPSREYPEKKLNESIALAVRNARDNFGPIDIFSARNMRTYKGDLQKIESFTRPIAEKWLEEKGVSYDNLTLGKPWCGVGGYYVDDRNLSLEEFVFKFSGPYSSVSIDVVIPIYNEALSIHVLHERNRMLERLFHVGAYIYVNNGSEDETDKVLAEIAAKDDKVKVVTLAENQGYGGGVKNGILEATSEFIMTNHADNQFDAYTFFLTHLEALQGKELTELQYLFPKRLNREAGETFRTCILQKVISLIVGDKVGDFNGQPKLVNRQSISSVSSLGADYTFDLSLYLSFITKKGMVLPIIQRDRIAGVSSWAGDMGKQLKIMLSYVRCAFSVKKSGGR
jgi:capsule biosynthesis phosphatase